MIVMTDEAEIQDMVTADQVKNHTKRSLKESRVLNRRDEEGQRHVYTYVCNDRAESRGE